MFQAMHCVVHALDNRTLNLHSVLLYDVYKRTQSLPLSLYIARSFVHDRSGISLKNILAKSNRILDCELSSLHGLSHLGQLLVDLSIPVFVLGGALVPIDPLLEVLRFLLLLFAKVHHLNWNKPWCSSRTIGLG
jgi:hypothetical protein